MIPSFARDFPKDAELDALVLAFARGDFAHVRAHAPKLAAASCDPEVKSAARMLRERTQADPIAKVLVLATAALLAALSAWWITHDGPAEVSPPPRHISQINEQIK